MADTFIGVPINSITEKATPASDDRFILDTPDGPRISKWGNIEALMKSGIKGNATQSNAPTTYSAETHPDGLIETYRAIEPLNNTSAWYTLADATNKSKFPITQDMLNTNDVLLTSTNGVVSVFLNLKPVVSANPTFNPVNNTEAPTMKGAADYVAESIKDVEEILFGNNTIPTYLTPKANITASPDTINPTLLSGYYLGFGTTNRGEIYPTQNIPAGTYTFYVVVNFSNKGQMDNFAGFIDPTADKTISKDDITVGQDLIFAFQRTLTTEFASGGLLAQVRTRYLSSSDTPASLTLKEVTVYNGNYTAQEITDSKLPVDKSKVLKAIEADTSVFAETAETVNTLPSKYFDQPSPLVDKKSSNYVTNIVEYNSAIGATTNYVTREGGLLKVGGTVNGFPGISSNHRLWFGLDFQPAIYASSAKSFYLLLKGRAKGVGIRNLKYTGASGATVNEIILQDMTDNVWSDFEVVLQLNYASGYSGNGRYTYTDYAAYTGYTNLSLDIEFSHFAVFERNALTDSLQISDFINIAEGNYISLNPATLPRTVVDQNYVNERISQSVVSKLSANDYKPKAEVEMIIDYGQSLAVGGGASTSLEDFDNTITFSTGMYMDSANSAATFIPAASSSIFTPVSAVVLAFLQLLKEENKVDIDDFGNKYLIATGGLSGGAITTMNKGTTPYSNTIASITRAKSLCTTQGKTFKVRAIKWTQGEGDRGQTQSAYYNSLKQLFTDFNTDIKAITGQTEDIIFVCYQPSPWRYVWYPSGSATQQAGDSNYDYSIAPQKAILQLAKEEANVYLSGAMYQYLYSDFFHPVDRAVVGHQQGIALKRILADEKDFPIFQPISHQVVGNYLHLEFSAPVLPIRFAVSDLWHNPNGIQPNFGFKVMKAGSNIISATPYIVKGNTVVIPCNTSPTGAVVEYATNGHYGGGNLCDSQNIIVNNKNTDYIVDNFCIAFDDYNV